MIGEYSNQITIPIGMKKRFLLWVQSDNTEQLRESLAELSNSVIPNNAESPLRSEKKLYDNYFGEIIFISDPIWI